MPESVLEEQEVVLMQTVQIYAEQCDRVIRIELNDGIRSDLRAQG